VREQFVKLLLNVEQQFFLFPKYPSTTDKAIFKLGPEPTLKLVFQG
jgi:hypothetical protein